MIGGRGTLVINRLITFGGAGYSMAAKSSLSLAGKKESMLFGYGGPGIGLKLFANEIVHIDIFNLFGFGGLKFKDSNQSGSVFVIEPELNAELNLFRFMQLGLGACYRFAFVGESLNIKSTDLFGFGGQVYVHFGWM